MRLSAAWWNYRHYPRRSRRNVRKRLLYAMEAQAHANLFLHMNSEPEIKRAKRKIERRTS